MSRKDSKVAATILWAMLICLSVVFLLRGSEQYPALLIALSVMGFLTLFALWVFDACDGVKGAWRVVELVGMIAFFIGIIFNSDAVAMVSLRLTLAGIFTALILQQGSQDR